MMDVQIVNHQNDDLCLRVNDVNQVAQNFGTVQLRPSFMDPGIPATSQWLDSQEKGAMAMALVLVILASWLP
jgi:hypothetical protein